MAQAPFVVDDKLTSIALAYRNESLIAEQVLPITPVPSDTFRWLNYDLYDEFTVPETRVGRTSAPNVVETGATESSAKTDDYGLDDLVPQRDLDRQSEVFRPLERATEYITQLMALDYEKAVSDLVFDAAQYPAANTEILSGTSQWSDFTNSDPLSKMLDVMDGLVMRPNVIVMGQAVWTQLRRHPRLVQAFHGNEGDQGLIPSSFLAQLLEVDQVVVGKGWINTARKGQDASLARIWGKHCLMLYRDRTAGAQTGITFGFTAQYGDRFAGQMQEPMVGLRGGTRVRVGWEIKPLISAPFLGYFLQNVVA